MQDFRTERIASSGRRATVSLCLACAIALPVGVVAADVAVLPVTEETVSVPVEVDPTWARAGVVALRLYVSRDDGRTWTTAGTFPPRAEALPATLDQDGEYVFAVRGLDRAASPHPAEPLAPRFRAVKDSTPPVLRLRGWRPFEDEFDVVWEAADRDLDPASLVIQVRPADSTKWSAVKVDPRSARIDGHTVRGRVRWTLRTPFDVRIRAGIRDRAGHLTTAAIDVRSPESPGEATATGSPRPYAAAAGTANRANAPKPAPADHAASQPARIAAFPNDARPQPAPEPATSIITPAAAWRPAQTPTATADDDERFQPVTTVSKERVEILQTSHQERPESKPTAGAHSSNVRVASLGRPASSEPRLGHWEHAPPKTSASRPPAKATNATAGGSNTRRDVTTDTKTPATAAPADTAPARLRDRLLALVRANPANRSLRHTYVDALLAESAFDEAVPHLKWLLVTTRDDEAARRKLERCYIELDRPAEALALRKLGSTHGPTVNPQRTPADVRPTHAPPPARAKPSSAPGMALIDLDAN